MKYAVETLEIEMHKLKEIMRINEQWMMKDAQECYAKNYNAASEKVEELQKAIKAIISAS